MSSCRYLCHHGLFHRPLPGGGVGGCFGPWAGSFGREAEEEADDPPGAALGFGEDLGAGFAFAFAFAAVVS